MVGGVVIGVTRTPERTHVHVADCPHYPKHGRGDECPRPDTCSVYTDEINARTGKRVEVKIGDSFWWQSGHCYWTPRENRYPQGKGRVGVTYDIQLTKLGFSH
jgi:Zn-finger protein